MRPNTNMASGNTELNKNMASGESDRNTSMASGETELKENMASEKSEPNANMASGETEPKANVASREWKLFKFAKCLEDKNEDPNSSWETFSEQEDSQIMLKVSQTGIVTVRRNESLLEMSDLRASNTSIFIRENCILVATVVSENQVRKWRVLFRGTNATQLCNDCYELMTHFTAEGDASTEVLEDAMEEDKHLLSPTIFNLNLSPPENFEVLDAEDVSVVLAEMDQTPIIFSQEETFSFHDVMGESVARKMADSPAAVSKGVTRTSKVTPSQSTSGDHGQHDRSLGSLHSGLVFEDDDIIEIPLETESTNQTASAVPILEKRSRKIGSRRAQLDETATMKRRNEAPNGSTRSTGPKRTKVQSKFSLTSLSEASLREMVKEILLDPELPNLVSKVHAIISSC